MTKWIKVISPESIQSDRIKLFFLSFFLSTALSGLLASLFLHSASIWLIATVDVITYCLGIMLIVSLRDIDSKRIGASKSQNVSSFSSVAISHEMRLSFTAVMMSQAIFQGAYTILVSYLPIKHFPLGLSGIGLFQLAASVGIILGFLCNWRFASLLKDRDGAFPKLIAAVVIAAICVYQIINAPLANSLIAFCAMNLVYECIWLFYNTEFFKRSPTEHSGTYQFTLSAWSAFVMAVFTFAYAIAIDTLGLLHGVELVLSLGLLIWMALIFAPSVKYKSASEAKV